MFKRRRRNKTDYRHRLAIIKSGKVRVVVRRSISGFRIQFVEFRPSGDVTLVDVASKSLRQYGWKGHCGNTSSAYLAGIVAGRKASRKNVKEAVLDIGLQTAVAGSSLFAAAKGVKDAGIEINIGEEAIPKESRINGTHIAEYAAKIKGKEEYARQFSAYAKSGLDPAHLPKNFEEVKERILKEV